jgi:hypothetical protein
MIEIGLGVTLVIDRGGGYALSPQAAAELARRKSLTLAGDGSGGSMVDASGVRIEDLVERNDPDLVAVVRAMGAAASGPGADLRVVEVPIRVGIEREASGEEVSVWGEGFTA